MCLKEPCSKVSVRKDLCDAFHIQNSLKQRDALLPLFVDFALGYAIGKVQKSQEVL
jgi:hypothetical protein